MKYLFFGTPDFAAIILEKLINAGFIPSAVVCNQDKPAGRKKIITPPPVKQIITNRKAQSAILQPENLKTIRDLLFALCPDLFIVAAYSQIIPKEILEIPRLGTIGVHPSLLPKYRGATPIQTAILNGDKITGTTLYLMDEKMDHGPILVTNNLPIAISDNYKKLSKKLAELSANLLIKTLLDIEEKIKNAKPQDESQATYTKKFTTEDAFIKQSDLEKAICESREIALQIKRKIRALNPEPGVFTIINNKRIKLLEAEVSKGKLNLITVQLAGKRPIQFQPELIAR